MTQIPAWELPQRLGDRHPHEPVSTRPVLQSASFGL